MYKKNTIQRQNIIKYFINITQKYTFLVYNNSHFNKAEQ